MAQFSVDTHLFRELGQLLVGRDSTALIELIKNAYDADATTVVVYGEAIDNPSRGYIRITDDGVGMLPDEFERGFLRIASRIKESGTRRSKRFKRRFTGAKGIGRLAAHKLARVLEVESIPWQRDPPARIHGVDATINWDEVEKHETLDKISHGALEVDHPSLSGKSKSGTTITLRKLRRKWTTAERGRFLLEARSFKPSEVLTSELPRSVVGQSLLFDEPHIRQTSRSRDDFQVELEGDFAGGDDYWEALIGEAQWVVEIDALTKKGQVAFCAAPTEKAREKNQFAKRQRLRINHPDPEEGPFFQARILIREGQAGGKALGKWAARACGIRVFLEGFRVLPYGEPTNDWLSIDADYASRTLPQVAQQWFKSDDDLREAGQLNLPNRSYFGGVFLTQEGASSLRMLANREGFVPEAGYDTLTTIVRTGIALSTRLRASCRHQLEAATPKADLGDEKGRTYEAHAATVLELRHNVKVTVDRAKELASDAERLAKEGDLPAARKRIAEVVAAVNDVREGVSEASDMLISETAMLRILASVGTQMAAFIHEINALLGMAESIERAIVRLRGEIQLPRRLTSQVARLNATVGDLRRHLERQASYLVDVVTPDVRRRRSRQRLADRFDSAARLVEPIAERRAIRIENRIARDLKSPAMFPAELTTVFSNLLTNAVKAAGDGGKIRASSRKGAKGSTVILIQNTGKRVRPPTGERWFKPFESTTSKVDPVLGQGMGLGLPITRSMLSEYGAEICFVEPTTGFSTAVQIAFADE